ncbi:UDP-N-acetylmuramate--L-alanine ligase, partial [Kribbia dieselivorans]|uniref:UDP-N-acetylmuramate--L-alanine ligase n=1 Tax=Kribbia dieselivorans TaxID=331526 RepID=UPI000838E837
NVELAAARAAGIPVLHRSQALAAAAQGRRRVTIAGANGKTTTASMLTVALRHVGVPASFALGGELATAGTNAELDGGPGDPFVIEADESDGSFVVYRPEVAVVTNVQPDHLDFFGDFERVKAAYLEFTRTIEPGGVLIACADDPGSDGLAAAAEAAGVQTLTYGRADHADVRLTDVMFDGLNSSATIVDIDGEERALRLGVPGLHNLLNATAAYLAGSTAGLGHEPDAILAGLTAFDGTRRRFERKGEVRGVVVIDDYAHNVGKVDAVISTARALADDRRGELIVVFQPHLYSRTRDFATGFARALRPADEVVLLDIYGAREDPVPGVTSELIAAPLREADRSVRVSPREEVPAGVASRARTGDVVLIVGAGDVTEVGPEVLTALGAS